MALKRARAEAFACSALSHENVVRVLDFVVATDEPSHVVMEHLGGESLHAMLKGRRRLDPRFTVDLARQVCAALGAAHQQEITHRDLKPQNIFVSDSGRVTVLDFGISALLEAARNAAPMHTTGLFAGTPYCMAPELARGEPTDNRTDIYGLGVVLYRALTGVLPFQGVTFVEVLASMLTKPVPPFSDHLKPGEIHGELERGVMCALSKDPALRQADVETLDRELAAALAALPKGVPHAPVEQPAAGEVGARSQASISAPPPAPYSAVASALERARRRFSWLRLALHPALLTILLLSYGLLMGNPRVDQGALLEVPILGGVIFALGCLLELGFRVASRRDAVRPPAGASPASGGSRVEERSRPLGWVLITLLVVVGTYLVQLYGSIGSYLVVIYSLVIGFSHTSHQPAGGALRDHALQPLLRRGRLGRAAGDVHYARLFVGAQMPTPGLTAGVTAGVVILLWLTYAGLHLLTTGQEQRALAQERVTDNLVARTKELLGGPGRAQGGAGSAARVRDPGQDRAAGGRYPARNQHSAGDLLLLAGHAGTRPEPRARLPRAPRGGGRHRRQQGALHHRRPGGPLRRAAYQQ